MSKVKEEASLVIVLSCFAIFVVTVLVLHFKTPLTADYKFPNEQFLEYPPYDFAKAHSQVAEYVLFLEKHNLHTGYANPLLRRGDMQVKYEKLVWTRDSLAILANTYPDSASANHDTTAAFAASVRPLLRTVRYPETWYINTYYMYHQNLGWTIACMLSIFGIIIGTVKMENA